MKNIHPKEAERRAIIAEKLDQIEAEVKLMVQSNQRTEQNIGERTVKFNSRDDRRSGTRSLRSLEREENSRRTHIQYVLPEFENNTSPMSYINEHRQY